MTTPLEATPEVISSLMASLGVPSRLLVSDLVGTEESDLQLLPAGKLIGLLLVLPKDQTPAKPHEANPESNLFFIQDCGEGLCGSAALIHVLANSKSDMVVGGIIGKFIQAASGLGAKQRGELLVDTEEIVTAHNNAAKLNTEKEAGEVAHHIIALINTGDNTILMDDRMEGPVDLGGEEKFGSRALEEVRSYMVNQESIDFSLLALVMTE